ncbi:MAG: transcription elongation factor GreA [Firmicutes bacterium]|nr:transcription elongation factor GreA [Bacillota bacterium]MDY5676493.1 transcription elongation factor GreA [Eubacteriales bacterium]
MAEVYLTKEAYKELEDKLARLKSEGRVEVAKKIQFARSFGDISENSEYDAAREEEAILEQEIVQIEETLRNAQIISKSANDTSKVGVGALVELYDMEFDEKMTLKIMGSIESDPTSGKISNESPLGKALIGASKGQEVDVTTPAGVQRYKVLSIKY